MNDHAVATIRTGVNSTWIAVAATLLSNVFGWEVHVDELLPYTPIILAGFGVFYRLSLWLSEVVPVLGYILFGIPRTPHYAAPSSTSAE